MDRIIEVKVNGNYLSKDNKYAGVQGEANVTYLRIEFDDSWNTYAKKVTWWDAKGNNPVEITLTTALLENTAASTLIYLCPIPAEPLAEAGECTFVIDGWQDGKRARTISDTLYVKGAPFIEQADQPVDPTPTQAEQLQAGIDAINEDIKGAVSSVEAATAAAAAAAQSETNARSSETVAAASAEAAAGAEAAAKKAAEAAAKSAAEAADIAGGDLATRAEAQGYADAATDAANAYTDQKIAEIPTPDVSGQINTHNTDATAHSDIRTAVSEAASAAANALSVANSKATTVTYTVSVDTTWTENSAGGYYKTVPVSGMLESDNPIADVILGADVEANALYLEAWGCVTRITTAENSITLYANGDAPSAAFDIQLKVVR